MSKETKITKKTKKTIPWRKSLGIAFLPRLCFFCFFWFSSSFLVFLSPVAVSLQKNQNNQKNQKKTIPWRKSLGIAFLPRLWVFCFFCFFGFLRVFLVFLSPVANARFPPQKQTNNPRFFHPKLANPEYFTNYICAAGRVRLTAVDLRTLYLGISCRLLFQKRMASWTQNLWLLGRMLLNMKFLRRTQELKTTPFRKLGLTLSGKARCFRIAWWPSASFKRTICNWTLLGTWAFKPNGGGRSCKSFFSMASLYSRPSSWKSMADWYPVTTSKMWTVGLADVSRSSRGNDNQSKLPRGRSGVTMGEVWRMESPSVICFRSSKVKFSASTAMMVSEEQMNAMREYSCLKPIYWTVLLLPDIFISSCKTVLLFGALGHWIMFRVQPFHIFAFYFVLCCGLVDFLKSSVFCENYTGAQGPPLLL